MRRSLQRHLSRMLALGILGGGIVASLGSFYFAYAEAQEFQDDTLRQIAALSVGARSELQRLNVAERAVEDPESRIRVVRLPQGPRPSWLPSGIGPGFHTLDTREAPGRMRVFVRDAQQGQRLIVAQSTDSRDEIAFNSALRTLIPLLVLLPLLVGLTTQIVRRELTPLRHLSEGLDRQAVDKLVPLQDRQVPEEITPFVHAINRLLARVNQLLAQQRRFIADAAHELRTPLTALSVQADNLRQADSMQTMRERIEPLRAGIERARQLSEQLLSLARTQAGPQAQAVVDVSVLARELLAEFLPMAEARDIDVGLDEGARLSLRAPPEPLRLILGNALDNALKYTPAGGEVTIRLRSEEGDAVIEVVDNGPGIPAEERQRVFDAFYRLPGTTGMGSGLGLSITREAASRLGGTIRLDGRRPGPGLVFSYRQPLQA